MTIQLFEITKSRKSIYLKPEELDDVVSKDVKGKKAHWGYHLILDCSRCNKAIDNPEVVKVYLLDLVKLLKMKKIEDPMVIQFPLQGHTLSACQMIDTSSITFHSDNDEWCCFIDVFSCKVFNPKVAIAATKKYFKPQNIGARWIYRDAGPWPMK